MLDIPSFLQFALLGAIISSISSGIMGSFVVIKRISSITGSIAHSILGGIGLFEFLKYKYGLAFLDPIWGAILAALFSALLIGIVHLYYKQKEDAVIAMIWSCGMAIGIIFLSFVPNKSATCTHFLFGDLFTTQKKDLFLLGGLDIIIFILTVIFYRKFLLICFDETSAYLQKILVKTFYFILLAMISISIVLLIKIVGIILIITLFTIPATIANFFSFRLPIVMIISVFLCMVFNILGIFISNVISLPPGAVIAIVATIFYIIALPFKKLLISPND